MTVVESAFFRSAFEEESSLAFAAMAFNPSSLWMLRITALLALLLPLASTSQPQCVYSLYIRTGSIIRGGTDSTIGIQLFDASNNSIAISDLIEWGGMLPPHNYRYFQRGNLDIFSGLGECLATPICKVTLQSDGSGPHHGWYVNYVEVTSTGPHIPCSQHLFTVEQWLATDAYPYQLSVTKDACTYDSQLELPGVE